MRDLRTIEIGGAPWFHATDVCRCLGLSLKSGVFNYTVKLGDDEKRSLVRTPQQMRGLQEFFGKTGRATAISESGLYKLIMRSDKDTARPFQDWVTKVVLGRKEGIGSPLFAGTRGHTDKP